MKSKIYVPDIECESCVKVISKKFKELQGIAHYTVHLDSIDVVYDESTITAGDLIATIENLGFRASVRPFERKSFKERWNDFKQHPEKYYMPVKAMKYFAATLSILILMQLIAYIGFLNEIPNFFVKYAIWILYLDISIASLGAAIWYMASYKGNVTCMTGMMIGMTVAMQTGMMIGAVIGGTNGFFIGATVGMTLAVLGGTIIGSACGIMGAVQGMMSGVMAGTMGAMITVMMITDNVFVFMPYYMLLNVVILFGLMYLFYEEVVEDKKLVKMVSVDFPTFASACIISTTILTALVIYGPKSPLFM